MVKIINNEKEMFYDILGFDMTGIKVTGYERLEKKIILTVEGKFKSCECPKCGKRTSKRNGLHKVMLKPLRKHLYLSDGTMIELRLVKRHFRCKKCEIGFMERFVFEAEKGERTKSFEDYVKFSWGHMSGSQIARNTQCSDWLIHDILKDIDPESLNKRGMEIMKKLDEIYLGVDEHSFSGRDMVLVITDIKEKKVLAVLESTTNDSLSNWFQELPEEIKDKIQGISTDMNKGYKNVAEKYVKDIVGTVDKYHLVQEANRMVDDVRKINIWLIKMGFMKEEDFLQNKRVTKSLLAKKK